MRWAVPVAAVAVVAAAAGAGPVIAAVQGDPALPDRTPAQLLAEAARTAEQGRIPPMSGTLVETASLGLPGLPASTSTASPLSLLSGAHEARVWYRDLDHVRVAIPGQMSETNLIRNGDQMWLYESAANTATRIKVPAEPAPPATAAMPLPTGGPADLTPQQLADRLLDAVGDDTTVSVRADVQVADRAAYQLVLAPQAAGSLIKEITVALDGETYVPLRVQVFTRNAIEPALELGYTSVTFSPPAEENFAFTPPAGAKVEERTVDLDAFAGQDLGHGDVEAEPVGEGWTTVLVMPFDEGELRGAAGGDGEAAGLTSSVLNLAKPVKGAWGSGRLIETKLVTALLTDDGRVIAGAVRPEVLYEAAGRR